MNEATRSRRGFLLGALVDARGAGRRGACARGCRRSRSPATVDIENFSAAGKSLGKGHRGARGQDR